MPNLDFFSYIGAPYMLNSKNSCPEFTFNAVHKKKRLSTQPLKNQKKFTRTHPGCKSKDQTTYQLTQQLFKYLLCCLGMDMS